MNLASISPFFYIYTLDPYALFAHFKTRGASFVKELSFIDQGLGVQADRR